MPGFDRRTFLGLSMGAVAWACARGEDVAAPDTPTPETNMFSVQATTPPGALAVGDSRLAFAFFDADEPFAPRAEDVRLTLAPPDGPSPQPFEPRIEQIRLGVGGEVDRQAGSQVHALSVIEHPLEIPGIYSVQAEVRHDGEIKRGTATMQVVEAAESTTPVVGEQAIAVPSPTPDDPMGADPICTRRPMCTMHDLTVEQAVGAGLPSVIMFATPAFCTSRTCGPVIDIAEAIKDQFVGTVNFVHVEVWKDAGSVNDYPDGAVQAFVDWQLQVEPWIFYVGPDGEIKERWAGAWGPGETERAVTALAAGDL